MKTIRLLPLALLLAAPGVRADFSFTQTSEMTGGVLHGAMKMAGAFSKKAREPIVTKTAVKGNRMASIMDEQITVTDVDAETITTIHPKKKEYSVVTFEQMRQYLEQMSQKAKKKKDESDPQLDFSVSVEKTDNERDIDGQTAREVRLKMKIQGQNPQTGDSGQMDMLMQSWMAKPASGYEEVQEFYKKYAGKLNWMPNTAMAMFSGGAQGGQQGMAELTEEMAKMNGMPLLQVVSMGTGDLSQPASESSAGPQGPSGAQMAEALKGLGGFGRFGKKKKEPEPEPQAAEGQQASGPSKLMEMTIRYSGYSSASVDPSLVDTEPAGFKLVKSQIEKALR